MNNILTLFHGYVGVLLDNQGLDAETIEGLVKIKDGARAASELMDRTQALVRPPATIWRDVDLGAFTSILNPQFTALCGPSTKLHVFVPDNLPRVRCDAGRVKTALFELVKNACEATFASGGDVWIELSGEMPSRGLSAAAQPARWVTIKVSDAGPGVAPEIRERIFMPFFTTKKKQSAAGLGLAVVEGVVQQHGGVLKLESADERTTFTLRLPSRAE
ncbi:MAG: HAMP domain-containing sensor histidine kinase [Chthoniobacteraceae bacterium]